jgi:hypothetical protein
MQGKQKETEKCMVIFQPSGRKGCKENGGSRGQGHLAWLRYVASHDKGEYGGSRCGW